MIIAAAILSLTIAIYLVARWTVNRMRRDDPVDHGDLSEVIKEWLIKAASAIPGTILFWWKDHWLAIPMCMAYYFLAFGACIGILTGNGIDYTGSDWLGKSWTSRIPFWARVIITGVFIFLYVKSL